MIHSPRRGLKGTAPLPPAARGKGLRNVISAIAPRGAVRVKAKRYARNSTGPARASIDVPAQVRSVEAFGANPQHLDGTADGTGHW
jgi:hypothetical protein